METALITTNNRRFTSDIVAAYLRNNPIQTDQIPVLITAVHSALAGLGQPEPPPPPPKVGAVTVRRSVTPDRVICIECGWQGKMLKRHLQSQHGLTVAQYRQRWNLSLEHPMTAPNYSEKRSLFAKNIGLGLGGRGGSTPAPAAPAPAPEPTPPSPEKPKRARTKTAAKKVVTKKAGAKKTAFKAKKPAAKKVVAKKTAARKPARKTVAKPATENAAPENATV